jgi:hypothetical protein
MIAMVPQGAKMRPQSYRNGANAWFLGAPDYPEARWTHRGAQCPWASRVYKMRPFETNTFFEKRFRLKRELLRDIFGHLACDVYYTMYICCVLLFVCVWREGEGTMAPDLRIGRFSQFIMFVTKQVAVRGLVALLSPICMCAPFWICCIKHKHTQLIVL